jgi:hypothetical protein
MQWRVSRHSKHSTLFAPTSNHVGGYIFIYIYIYIYIYIREAQEGTDDRGVLVPPGTVAGAVPLGLVSEGWLP